MFEKKLITLACFVGILACGACFLPPLPRKKVSLPPALASLHRVAIHVEDGTSSNLFDSQIMSNATAGNFNQLWKDYPVRAEVFNAGVHTDAVLRIAVHSKTSSCARKNNGKQFCSFEIISSFTLKSADGSILRHMEQGSSRFGLWYQGDSLPDNLNANPFRQEASYSLAMTAGNLICTGTN